MCLTAEPTGFAFFRAPAAPNRDGNPQPRRTVANDVRVIVAISTRLFQQRRDPKTRPRVERTSLQALLVPAKKTCSVPWGRRVVRPPRGATLEHRRAQATNDRSLVGEHVLLLVGRAHALRGSRCGETIAGATRTPHCCGYRANEAVRTPCGTAWEARKSRTRKTPGGRDRRGLDDVTHEEALHGLVLGHHGAGGLAEHALDLSRRGRRGGKGVRGPFRSRRRGGGRAMGRRGPRVMKRVDDRWTSEANARGGASQRRPPPGSIPSARMELARRSSSNS